MDRKGHPTLEQSLADTEANTVATLKAAASLLRPLRRCRVAAQVGDLEELSHSLEAAELAIDELHQQLMKTRLASEFDARQYLSQGKYAQEVLDTAQGLGVSIFKREDRLYCHPVLVRVSPNDKAVFINRKRERRIRPSAFVKQLKDLQQRPPRFRPESFLTALLQAYTQVVAQRRNEDLSSAPVVPLVELYKLLTLLPGQVKEYSRQEFVRDIYLLHRSGRDTTHTGAKVSFPISRGVRGKTLAVVDEAGEERHYYGIRFVQANSGGPSGGHA